MLFGRKEQHGIICLTRDEKFSYRKAFTIAELLVVIEHCGIAAFEFGGKSLPHNAENIHGIHNDFGGRGKNITLQVNKRTFHLIINLYKKFFEIILDDSKKINQQLTT